MVRLGGCSVLNKKGGYVQKTFNTRQMPTLLFGLNLTSKRHLRNHAIFPVHGGSVWIRKPGTGHQVV